MKFEDGHVVENKETHQQHIFCGAKDFAALRRDSK